LSQIKQQTSTDSCRRKQFLKENITKSNNSAGIAEMREQTLLFVSRARDKDIAVDKHRIELSAQHCIPTFLSYRKSWIVILSFPFQPLSHEPNRSRSERCFLCGFWNISV